MASSESIADEIWGLLKQWWGMESEAGELRRIEVAAQARRVHPLQQLKDGVRYVVENSLWG